MIYHVLAWDFDSKHNKARIQVNRYYKVAEEGDIRGIGESYCDDFYDLLLHLLLDHQFTVECWIIDKEKLPEDAVISVL